MSLRRDHKGFIFSLDAALAMLVVMIVMAGVARVGGPESIYGQHGYLRLERYANDALEVMHLTGTIGEIENLLARRENFAARSLAEKELQGILPRGVRFRLRIGGETKPRLDAGWRGAFENAGEIAAAARVSIFRPENVFEPITLYVWRGARI
jgi:hypothetical protein